MMNKQQQLNFQYSTAEMRNYSRQIPSTYYKFQSLPRNYTQEKRLQELHTLKQSQVKVGIYKYSTEDELGKGYSSKVYKGVQIQKVHKRYAIKVIQLKKFRGSNLEMLEAEIQIHRNLIHENILRLYEVIKTPYFYYLILQYCPHGNLHEYIKQKKKLTENNSIQIMEQVLAGFKYLLQEGVIHRDLKPANILRVGNKWKISDFGFSVKSKYGFKDRINVGTPLYMSPQSLKKSYYSSKSDIFALGVTLFEMLQGRTPWQCSNQKQLLEKMKAQITIPNHIKSPIIREFIFRACHLNETKRMTKQQLLQFQIRVPLTPSQINNTKVSQRSSAIAMSSNPSRIVSRKPSVTADIQVVAKPTEDFIKYNNQVLGNQFLIVKHIYSCIKNIDCFLIQSQKRQIFTLTIFKLILRLIRFLCDKQSNSFNLKNWLQYITTKSYSDMYQQMVQYSQQLQKEYLEYIKHNDIKIIRNVNRKFPDLCHSAPISDKFYDALKEFIKVIIRQHNHQLMQLYANSLDKEKSPESSQQKIMEKPAPEKSEIKQELEKEEKSVKTSSAPRKIYQSKRSLRNTSSLKLDPSFQQSCQSLKNGQEKNQISKQKAEVKTIIDEQAKLTLSKQQISLPLSNRPSRQQQVKQSQQHIKSQTSINAVSSSLNDKIQALESLYTIYRTSELRSQQEQKDIGEKIKVISNYTQSKLDKRDYLDLRRLLRSM